PYRDIPMFYQDLFNRVIAWWRSRRWWRMSLVAFLPLSLLLISCGLVVYGAMLSRQTLATRYLTLIQEDLDTSFNDLLNADGVATAEAQRQSAALARIDERRVQVPMRRILQLGNFSPRVAYVVASQMAQQGRLGMAARMMRDI